MPLNSGEGEENSMKKENTYWFSCGVSSCHCCF